MLKQQSQQQTGQKQRKRSYEMAEPMEFESQARTAQLAQKQSRRAPLGEIRNKANRTTGQNAFKTQPKVSIYHDKNTPPRETDELFIPDSISSIGSSPGSSNRVVVPDIDINDDIYCVPEYAADIAAHLREAELRTRPKPNYLRKQTDLKPHMRAILIDWLCEVSIEYNLNDETLYLAVNYIDRFLSHMAVLKGKLQLVGTAAMLLASKFEEIWAPEVKDFVYITDETYNRDQVLRMEQLMIKTLKFDICCVTPIQFVNRLLRAIQADQQTVDFAKFLLDLTLLEYNLVKFCPSLVTTAVVLQANYVTRGQGWSDALEHYSGYSYEAVEPVLDEVQSLHAASHQPEWTYRTVHGKHEAISTLPPRSGRPPREESQLTGTSL